MAKQTVKGEKEFTQQKIDEIECLIEQKLKAPDNEQVRIRKKIRNEYGFYWTDFYGRDTKYNVENFRKLIKDKRIIIKK